MKKRLLAVALGAAISTFGMFGTVGVAHASCTVIVEGGSCIEQGICRAVSRVQAVDCIQ